MSAAATVLAAALAACDPVGSGGAATSPVPSTTVAPTSTSAGATEIALTRSWPCGHGFWMSDAIQSVALMIQWNGEDDDVVVGEEVNLPDPQWTATVSFGSDLFANWCNDVVDPKTLQRVVVLQTPVLVGTITPLQTPEGTSCPGALARLDVSGLSADGPRARSWFPIRRW